MLIDEFDSPVVAIYGIPNVSDTLVGSAKEDNISGHQLPPSPASPSELAHSVTMTDANKVVNRKEAKFGHAFRGRVASIHWVA
jgi:hypothetical protein